MSLKGTDWRAIKWYMAEYNYTVRDMMAWPEVRFRDHKDKIVDVNIFVIRAKYDKRPKAKKVAA